MRNALFRRSFFTQECLRSKIDLNKEFQSLRLDQVHDLPIESNIALSSQTFHAKSAVDETKSPLVMIHGLFGAKQNYASVGRKISSATKTAVVGIDMRNHGSSAHVFPHTYMLMAGDTIRHIEGLQRKVVLAGHLMGAKVSMLVALLRPELVEKLIVIDNAPVNHVLDAQFTRDLLGMCHVERDLSLGEMPQAALLHNVDKILTKFEKDKLVRLFLESNLVRRHNKDKKAPVKFRVPVLNFLKHDTLRDMGMWPGEAVQGKTFGGPVLVMRGIRSQFVTDANLQNDFPLYFSDVLSVDYDSGHWVVSEQPDQFVNETVEFLEN